MSTMSKSKFHIVVDMNVIGTGQLKQTTAACPRPGTPGYSAKIVVVRYSFCKKSRGCCLTEVLLEAISPSVAAAAQFGLDSKNASVRQLLPLALLSRLSLDSRHHFATCSCALFPDLNISTCSLPGGHIVFMPQEYS